jgi:hypothetical protein
MKPLIPIIVLVDAGAPIGMIVDALQDAAKASGRTLAGTVPGATHSRELGALLGQHLAAGCQVLTLREPEPRESLPAESLPVERPNVITLPVRRRAQHTNQLSPPPAA